MRYRFFKVSAVDPEADSDVLNRCLGAGSVLAVERQFVPAGIESFWSVCVVLGDAQPTSGRRQRGETVDYREVLSPDEFAVFARLRALRKRLAQEQAVPVYAIFSNEQLAAIARLAEPTRAAMAAIEGVGEKRLEQYAEVFLAECRRDAGTGNA